MKRLFLPILLLLPLSSQAAETVTITAEQWARPRTAEAVLAFPGLGPLLEEFERAPDSRIVIRHGGDDEAVLWAEELRSWLVALGVPAARIRLQADLATAEHVLLDARGRGSEP